MTVRDVYERMTAEELVGWVAFLEMQRLEQDAAQRRAQRLRR
jgi:hypothetical protein